MTSYFHNDLYLTSIRTENLIRQAIVILLSLAVVAFAAFSMYAVWFLSGQLNSFLRGVTSLFAWIIAFAAGSRTLWKVVSRLSKIEA